MYPFPFSIKKITALGVMLLALILPACTGSWLADPLSRYVRQKTGLDIQIKEVNLDLWSLGLELKKITLGVDQKSAQGRVVIPDLSLRLSWEFSEGFPFLPRLGVEQLILDSPQVSLKVFKTEEKGDWRDWLKKIPAIRKWEIRNLSGRVEQEGKVFQIPPGANFSGSFRLNQESRVSFYCPKIAGSSSTPYRSFKGQVRGSMEISPDSEPFIWKSTLAFSGTYQETDRVRLERLSGNLRVEGTAAGLEVKETLIHFPQVEASIGSYSLKGEGPLTLRGSLRLILSDHHTRVFPKWTVRGEGIQYTLKRDAQQIIGQALGQLQIEGSWDHPALRGLLETTRTSLELDAIKIAGLEARLEFEGDMARVAFPRVTARAESFHWDRGGRPLLLRDAETKFTALFVPGRNRWRLEEILLRAEPWGALQGALVFDPALGAAPGGSVRFSRFPLLRLINLLTSGPVQKEMEGWPLSGTFSWERTKKDGPLDCRLALEAYGLEGTEAGGRSWAVNALDTRVTARFDWDTSCREIAGFWKLDFLKGSLAYNDWSFSFNPYPLPLEFSGKIRYPPDGFQVRGSWNFQHPPLGSWTGSGKLNWHSLTIQYQGQVKGTGIPLEKSTLLLAGQAEGKRFPWLRGVAPRGLISTELSLSGSNREYEIEGRVRGSDLDVDLRDPGIHFHISHLDLPVRWGSSPSRGPRDLELRSGRIQFQDIRTPWSSLPSLEIPVRAGFKVYRIPEPLVVPLWGAMVTAREIALDGSGDQLSLQARVNLKEMELSDLLPASGIEGKLAGDLGTVTLNAAQVSASGELSAQVFEGTVTARDLKLVQPFSVERRFQGDILFDHINLEPVTQLFSFGKISGFVQGTIEDLSVVRDYPERFRLTLKTQEVAGVPKKINVQAIENLSLLGTGWGEMGGLRTGINRWFQEYSYREIGLTCTLAKGRVSLRGTILEEGLEFLVRKSGLTGIDIINRNPENEIDFSDMLERIRRIQKNKAQGGKNDAK